MTDDVLLLPVFAGLRQSLETWEEEGVTRDSPISQLRREMGRRGYQVRVNTPRLFMLKRLGLVEDA